MGMKIDLNCDMGEGFGRYSFGLDEKLMQSVSSVNIACGFHAGDPMIMDATVKLARRFGVAVGAHPGYPDLAGFGRRNLECSPEEIRQYCIYQIGALQGICTANGTRLKHVKPHGALYNLAMKNEAALQAVVDSVALIDPNLSLICLAGLGSAMISQIAAASGVRVIFEAFPDRAYEDDGSLVQRKKPGATIHDPLEAARRALLMVRDGRITSIHNVEFPVQAETLCVHGDSPDAVYMVQMIRQQLEQAGCRISPVV